jgi:hypothetical protein
VRDPRKLTPEQAKQVLAQYQESLALSHYTPSPTQQRFHESVAYDRLLTAGGRGGKTTAALVDLSWVALGIHPHRPWYGPVTIIVLCISRQNAAAVVQRKLLEACELPGKIGASPFLPHDEIDWDESASAKVPYRTYYNIKLKNGSQIHFGWSGDTHSWEKLQGIKADYVYIDENAGSEKLVIELMKRLLDVQSDPSKQPWGGCLVWGATGTIVNPTFERYRERCLKGENDSAAFVIPPGETGAVSKEAHARFAKKLTKEQRKIHIDGTETASSLTYIFGKQWDDRRHLLANDYEIQDDDNVFVSYDPGVDHPTGILVAAVRKAAPHQLICAKFFNHRLESVDYDIECLHSYLKGRKIGLFVYDYRAKERHKHAPPLIHSIATKMEAKGYVPIQGYYPCDKRHEVGIATVREYLDPNVFDRSVPPMIVLSPSEESGGSLMRSQLVSYRGKEETNFTGAGGVVKKDDEFPDCLRYLCRLTPSWSASLVCGPATHVSPRPLEEPTRHVGAPAVFVTPEQLRAQKSKLVAMRNRSSVAREFSYVRRPAAVGA